MRRDGTEARQIGGGRGGGKAAEEVAGMGVSREQEGLDRKTCTEHYRIECLLTCWPVQLPVVTIIQVYAVVCTDTGGHETVRLHAGDLLAAAFI